MDPQWQEGSPIYRQLRDRVVAMILEGVLKEGDPLPSVRSVAAEFRVNPLTVLKGYQQLVDESLVEKRRGLGMYVNAGARQALALCYPGFRHAPIAKGIDHRGVGGVGASDDVVGELLWCAQGKLEGFYQPPRCKIVCHEVGIAQRHTHAVEGCLHGK